MDIFENGTRFDPLIELNHPLHKEKRSQLSRTWLNQETVNREAGVHFGSKVVYYVRHLITHI